MNRQNAPGGRSGLPPWLRFVVVFVPTLGLAAVLAVFARSTVAPLWISLFALVASMLAALPETTRQSAFSRLASRPFLLAALPPVLLAIGSYVGLAWWLDRGPVPLTVEPSVKTVRINEFAVFQVKGMPNRDGGAEYTATISVRDEDAVNSTCSRSVMLDIWTEQAASRHPQASGLTTSTSTTVTLRVPNPGEFDIRIRPRYDRPNSCVEIISVDKVVGPR